MHWLDLLATQETLKSLLQHHSSKASILWHSAFFIVQLSHSYWRRQWHPTPVLLPRKSHGGRSLVRLQSMGSLRVRHDWETSLSLFISCIGEGNGNPLQCSCLENPRDGEAWWAAVYGVTQSRTQLKRLCSSSSSSSEGKYMHDRSSFMAPQLHFK